MSIKIELNIKNTSNSYEPMLLNGYTRYIKGSYIGTGGDASTAILVSSGVSKLSTTINIPEDFTPLMLRIISSETFWLSNIGSTSYNQISLAYNNYTELWGLQEDYTDVTPISDNFCTFYFNEKNKKYYTRYFVSKTTNISRKHGQMVEIELTNNSIILSGMIYSRTGGSDSSGFGATYYYDAYNKKDITYDWYCLGE